MWLCVLESLELYLRTDTHPVGWFVVNDLQNAGAEAGSCPKESACRPAFQGLPDKHLFVRALRGKIAGLQSVEPRHSALQSTRYVFPLGQCQQLAAEALAGLVIELSEYPTPTRSYFATPNL